MKSHDDATRFWSAEKVTAMSTAALAVIAFLTLVGAMAYFLYAESKEYTDSEVESVAVQVAGNTAAVVSLRTEMNARFDELNQDIDRRFDEQSMEMDRRFDEQSMEMDRRFKEQSEDRDRRFKEQSEERDRRFKEQTEDLDRRFDELRQWIIDSR